MLRPGMNEIIIRSGQRLPVRQYSWWRWENFQFRNVRLAPRYTLPEPIIRWAPTAEGEGLGGWAEVNRLRLDEQNQHLWLMGNREGQLLRAATDATPDWIELQGQAQGLSEQVLVDVAELGADQLLAGAQGLLWRREGGSWARVTGAPEAYAYVVLQHAGVWYAGFETHGVWYATQPQGPWQTAGLQGRTILDLAAGGSVLYAATDDGVYLRSETQWVRLPALPAGDNPQAAEFIPRLWAGPGGELIVRSEDRLFRRNMADAAENPWTPFGPPELQGNLFTAIRCCEPGTLLGTNGQGLWQQHLTGKWRRVDGDYFDNLEILDGAVAGSTLYVATANGLFASDLGSAEQAEPPFEWRKVRGLPPTVTDLLIDPLAAYRWVAATPSGVYRSEDGGRNFEMASGPWNIWDLAWGASGELWAARANGIVLAPAPDEADVEWRTAGGMQTVSFFTVSPQPDDSASVWAGSWGNNIGVSDDGGETLQPLHNGLETLSVLAILRHLSPGQLTVGTIEGLFRSDDGGTSWFKLPGDLTQQTVYALHQSPNGSIFAGAADGLWESADYGASWKPVLGLPPATVLRLGEVMVEGEPLLWAGTEDSGVWLSSDEGRTWHFGGLPGRSVYALVVDFNDESFVAATDQGPRMGTLASAR
jgi:photosystem II stability/assembly factor-like uncharacterized protein